MSVRYGVFEGKNPEMHGFALTLETSPPTMVRTCRACSWSLATSLMAGITPEHLVDDVCAYQGCLQGICSTSQDKRPCSFELNLYQGSDLVQTHPIFVPKRFFQERR